MDLYKFHDKPESLDHHEKAGHAVPDLILKRHGLKPDEMKKHYAALRRDSKGAATYACRYLHAPVPELEDVIAPSGSLSLWYAREAMHGAFPAGEPAIAKDSSLAVRYAAEITRRRFPLAEPKIAEDAMHAFNYAATFNKPWRDFKNVDNAVAKKAEENIAKDWRALQYAQTILKGPFLEAENAIAGDSTNALTYAKSVLKVRFPKGEPAIRKAPHLWEIYKKSFKIKDDE